MSSERASEMSTYDAQLIALGRARHSAEQGWRDAIRLLREQKKVLEEELALLRAEVQRLLDVDQRYLVDDYKHLYPAIARALKEEEPK